MFNRFVPSLPAMVGGVALAFLAPGCAPEPPPVDEAREEAIRSAHERQLRAKFALQTVQDDYLRPSDTATGNRRDALLLKAEAGFAEVTTKFADQTNIAAQAWRNLGNVRVAQLRTDAAIEAYRAVGDRYPTADWEILQSWKAAGDVLWQQGRTNDAVPFYRALVQRFDGMTNRPEVVGLVLKGARSKIQEAGAANR